MKRRNAYCSFCRKSYTEVGPLVEGPGDVYICGECTELCQAIIDQERRRRNPPAPPAEPLSLRARLDQLVTGQDEAKEALVLAAASRNEGGGRALLIGPSSSARLLLARALAHALEVPFAAGDPSDLVPSGVGTQQVPLLFFRLLQASDFDVEAAQRGVVFVDGAERADAQDALLRLWRYQACEPVAGFQLVVGGILFVCGGSFADLEETITRSGRHVEQPVRIDDLRAAGVRSDWVGYLTGVARVAPLDEENLLRIVHWVDFRGQTGDKP
jgi:ATP-dependent Clp protease ATP-binding subunit ClpX